MAFGQFRFGLFGNGRTVPAQQMTNYEETLAQTPFRDVNELKQVLLSENWSSSVNLSRLYVTFPSIQNDIDKRLMDGTIFDAVNYVNKVSNATRNSFQEKLVAVYSAFNSRGLKTSFQSELLHLGLPYREMADAWALSEAVSKCVGNTEKALSYIRNEAELSKVFTYQYIKAYTMDHSADVSDIDQAFENMDFYMQLRHLGIDAGKETTAMNRTFIQHGDPGYCPDQGIKLHLSAMNKEDYKQLLNNVVPDLIAAGAVFKVLRPEQFDALYQNETQAGKTITIYQTQTFHAREFFSRHPELFEQAGRNIIGDCNFGGRVYGRYGAFRGHTVMDPMSGFLYQDDRHRPYPEFMSGIHINDFIRGCESGDGYGIIEQNYHQMEYDGYELDAGLDR